MDNASEKNSFNPMRYDELKVAMDGLFAYDSGCTDSGIHDNALKERVNLTIDAMNQEDQRLTLSRLMREMWLSEDAIEGGYGWEDALAFGDWLQGDLRFS